MKKYLLILGIISMFLIAACGQQPQAAQPVQERGTAVIEPAAETIVEETEMESPATESVLPSEEPAEHARSTVKEFDMTAKQWQYTPSTITVNEGDNVVLNIKSIDVTHGFVISEFGVNERLTPGKTITAEFTADRKGEYIFFCSVPCGRGHGGMRGTLIVE